MIHMTEFGRATASVDALQALVADLAGAGALAPHCTHDASDKKPPPRGELATEGDWIVVFGLASAAEGQISEDERTKFWEAERIIAELEPTMARMQKKCEVRSSLEATKQKLGQELVRLFPDELPEASVTDDPVATAKGFISRGDYPDLVGETLRPLIVTAEELANASTYGTKMVERVLALVFRFDACVVRFKAEVVPRLGVAVASADVDDEVRAAEQRREAATRAAAEKDRAREEAKRPVAKLLEEIARGDQKLREQREEKAIVAEWQCVQSHSRSQAPIALSRSLLYS
jgi:hypothetical protein